MLELHLPNRFRQPAAACETPFHGLTVHLLPRIPRRVMLMGCPERIQTAPALMRSPASQEPGLLLLRHLWPKGQGPYPLGKQRVQEERQQYHTGHMYTQLQAFSCMYYTRRKEILFLCSPKRHNWIPMPFRERGSARIPLTKCCRNACYHRMA